jgi:hypothetical protein
MSLVMNKKSPVVNRTHSRAWKDDKEKSACPGYSESVSFYKPFK